MTFTGEANPQTCTLTSSSGRTRTTFLGSPMPEVHPQVRNRLPEHHRCDTDGSGPAAFAPEREKVVGVHDLEDGYLGQQLTKMQAWKMTDADAVVFGIATW